MGKRKLPRDARRGEEKKGLLRALYDRGSRLEIRLERGIVRLERAILARLRRKGKTRGA